MDSFKDYLFGEDPSKKEEFDFSHSENLVNKLEKEYYSKPGLNNSSLKLICPEQGGSIKKFKHYFVDGNKKEYQYSPSLDNGKLIHLYVELKDNMVVTEFTKPTIAIANLVEKFVETSDLAINELTEFEVETTLFNLCQQLEIYKSYKSKTIYDKVINEGLSYLHYLRRNQDPNTICITHKQKEILDNCIIAINDNHTMKNLLFTEPSLGVETYNEYEVYTEIPISSAVIDSIPVKGLLDRIIIDHNNKLITIIDFKTTSKPLAYYEKDFYHYQVDRQLTFYMLIFMTKHPEYKNYEVELVVCVQEINSLYENKVLTLTTEVANKALAKLGILICAITEGYETNWASVYEGIIGLEDLVTPENVINYTNESN